MDELQKLKLKVQALLERVSNLTAEYENRVADLRVELTEVTATKQALEETLQESQTRQIGETNGEVVQGETFDPGEYVEPTD